MPVDEGALVAEVVKDGPADKAGIKGGGKEIRFQATLVKLGRRRDHEGERPRASPASNDFSELITRFQPGDTISLELYRGDERRTATRDARRAARPGPRAASARCGSWSPSSRSACASTCCRTSARTPAAPTSRPAPAATSRSRSTRRRRRTSSASWPSRPPSRLLLGGPGTRWRPRARHPPRSVFAGRSDRRDAAGDGRPRVAAASRSPRPRSATAPRRWATSTSAAWSEIKSGTTFVAERGAGVEIRTANGERRTARPQPEHRHLPHVLDPRLPRPPRGAADRRCWAS